MAAHSDFSGRKFLKSTSTMTGPVYLRLSARALIAITESACTAKQESLAFMALTPGEAADFASIAAGAHSAHRRYARS